MFGGGTAVKYKATKGTDSFNKYGRTVNVNTILHCITAAISYSQKSIEELRFEDYSAGLKGPSGANGEDAGQMPLRYVHIVLCRQYRKKKMSTVTDHQHWTDRWTRTKSRQPWSRNIRNRGDWDSSEVQSNKRN